MPGAATLRQRATAALGVVTLVLAMLSAQLLARLDRVHVHVRCDEHGDLKHAEPHAARGAESAPGGAHASDGAPVAPANHHDHCLVGDVASPLVAALHAAFTVAAADLTTAARSRSPAPSAGLRLLLIAPKTSPPTLA